MNILKAALSWLLTKHVKKEQPKMSKIALAVSLSGYVLTVTVTDDSDIPSVGAGVVLSGDAGVTFTPASLTTGDAGTAQSTLSAAAGTYTVTASLADGTTASTSVTIPATTVEVTPVAEIKTSVQDFEKAFQFVADGVVSLGEGAKDELFALAKKYL